MTCASRERPPCCGREKSAGLRPSPSEKTCYAAETTLTTTSRSVLAFLRAGQRGVNGAHILASALPYEKVSFVRWNSPRRALFGFAFALRLCRAATHGVRSKEERSCQPGTLIIISPASRVQGEPKRSKMGA